MSSTHTELSVGVVESEGRRGEGDQPVTVVAWCWGERQHKVDTATPGGATLHTAGCQHQRLIKNQDRKIGIQFSIPGRAGSFMQFWVSWCGILKYKDEMRVKWADDISNKFSQSTWPGDWLSKESNSRGSWNSIISSRCSWFLNAQLIWNELTSWQFFYRVSGFTWGSVHTSNQF